MPCYRPLTAWTAKELNPNGKRSMVFRADLALQPDDPQQLPCGRCVGCRLEYSRQWAMRCVHEAQMHESNCFITLTFNDKSLYSRSCPLSLDVRDFQLFMKRLRKRFGSGIRFFHCGEYGSKNLRPHYHAALFGFDFPDKVLWRVTPAGERLYVSKSLEEIWPFGFSTIGSLTFESAAYVSRYILKKITGDNSFEHYCLLDIETGEYHGQRKPEYTTMSRRPGIGKTWFDKFSRDVYPDDFVVIKGKKMRPPRYYDGLLQAARPYEFDDVKAERKENARTTDNDSTPDRLAVKEYIKLRQIHDKLPRYLDDSL